MSATDRALVFCCLGMPCLFIPTVWSLQTWPFNQKEGLTGLRQLLYNISFDFGKEYQAGGGGYGGGGGGGGGGGRGGGGRKREIQR